MILRKETINVLPTKPYEEFKDPGNKMQRVTGERFSASDGTNGPLALSITGGTLLTGGLLFGGWLIWASLSSPGEACPENCRLGRGIGQIVGGAGAAVLGIPGLLMLGVGLSQYSERKSNPKRRMVVY